MSINHQENPIITRCTRNSDEILEPCSEQILLHPPWRMTHWYWTVWGSIHQFILHSNSGEYEHRWDKCTCGAHTNLYSNQLTALSQCDTAELFAPFQSDNFRWVPLNGGYPGLIHIVYIVGAEVVPFHQCFQVVIKPLDCISVETFGSGHRCRLGLSQWQLRVSR